MIIDVIIEKVADNAIGGPIVLLGRFVWWFYGTLIPFIIQWIGIPMFLLGVLLAVAFAGGTLLFTIVFCVVMYFFIKKILFDTLPKAVA
jgi:hypothetical protein